MKLIIPVAGKGTRMRPFTHTRPKPLLPVAGKPIIDHIMDRLLPLKPTGVVFVTGHLKDQFEEYIRENYTGKLNLSFVEQLHPRGTAEALWLAREAFDEDVLIVFSDTIFDADLSAIETCSSDGIFWAKEVDDPRRFGVMVTDENNHITQIVEKPEHFVSNLANIGVYYVKNTKLLQEGLAKAVEKLETSDDEVFHVDAFTHMIAHGAKIRVDPVQGWFDCGTMEATLETNKVLLDKSPGNEPQKETVRIVPPVAVHPTAKLSQCTIGPYVSIGKNCTVENSTLSNTILDNECSIQDSKLEESILGQHVRVYGKSGSFFLGDHSRIS